MIPDEIPDELLPDELRMSCLRFDAFKDNFLKAQHVCRTEKHLELYLFSPRLVGGWIAVFWLCRPATTV
jgi:hypothetical protein